MILRGIMKFSDSPFAILDKNINGLDYRKRNLIYEYFSRRERENKPTHNKSKN